VLVAFAVLLVLELEELFDDPQPAASTSAELTIKTERLLRIVRVLSGEPGGSAW
jgi:hypothetical protein